MLQIEKFLSTPPRNSLNDAKDDHYFALCEEVKADCLLTGDKDLLSIPSEALKEEGIPCRILTPQKFVEGLYFRPGVRPQSDNAGGAAL